MSAEEGSLCLKWHPPVGSERPEGPVACVVAAARALTTTEFQSHQPAFTLGEKLRS